ncbi:MAG: L-threonylcarbamoyladenylate synthase [Thermodesulfobacteriota bacterium]|nr:L-threonylcarbamoyladenylate synthase [Thermodesulfobacteriota bacterium]
MIISINHKNPQKRLVMKVVDTLKNGGVIACPTDTIYGLGCDIYNNKAIERIYQIKRQPKSKPMSFICASLKDISNYASISNFAYKTMKRLLPGPYTFILEATRTVPKVMLSKRNTVGIRIPDNEICLFIVRELGNPVISTSIKLPDEDNLLNEPELIQKKLGHLLDVVVDGGVSLYEPSTVVDLTTDEPVLVRKGKGDTGWLPDKGQE